MASQQSNFVRTCDQASEAGFGCDFAEGLDLIGDFPLHAHLRQRLRVRAGQHRHAENDCRRTCRACRRCDEHFASASSMNGEYLHVERDGRFYCVTHRVWNVVKFKIEKHSTAQRPNLSHNGRAAGREKLQTDFEKPHFACEYLDGAKGGFFIR